jgi:hypothetical protein
LSVLPEDEGFVSEAELFDSDDEPEEGSFEDSFFPPLSLAESPAPPLSELSFRPANQIAAVVHGQPNGKILVHQDASFIAKVVEDLFLDHCKRVDGV